MTVLNQDFFFILYFFGKNHIKLSVNILEINASESKYIYINYSSHSTPILQGKKQKERKEKYIH